MREAEWLADIHLHILCDDSLWWAYWWTLHQRLFDCREYQLILLLDNLTQYIGALVVYSEVIGWLQTRLLKENAVFIATDLNYI